MITGFPMYRKENIMDHDKSNLTLLVEAAIDSAIEVYEEIGTQKTLELADKLHVLRSKIDNDKLDVRFVSRDY